MSPKVLTLLSRQYEFDTSMNKFKDRRQSNDNKVLKSYLMPHFVVSDLALRIMLEVKVGKTLL